MIQKFLEINLCNDINFKYVLGKETSKNRVVLKKLIEVYLHRSIDHLEVMSEELKVNGNYDVQQVFDIFVKFNDKHKVDIEVQFVDVKSEIAHRAYYYLAKVSSSQLDRGDDYKSMGNSYVLLFLNYKRYDDDRLVHDFQMNTRDGIPWDEEYVLQNIITVEIPKVKYSEDMDEEEMWAYMFQSSGSKDPSKKEKIQSLMKKQKEIHMLVECTDEIQRSEKEWLEDFNERRMEHNIASQKARWKEQGIEEGMKKKEVEDILAVSKYMTLDQIAEAFKLEESYVQSIIDSHANK